MDNNRIKSIVKLDGWLDVDEFIRSEIEKPTIVDEQASNEVIARNVVADQLANKKIIGALAKLRSMATVGIGERQTYK